MYKLKLTHGFAAAHQLEHAYSAECNNFKHGHNWKVIITIETPELVNNMVVDFKILKEEVNRLDHKDLNTLLEFESTAENLAKYLHNVIENRINAEDQLAGLTEPRQMKLKIELFEAEKASITYSV